MSDIGKKVAADLRADAAEHQAKVDAAQVIVDQESAIVAKEEAAAEALEADTPPVVTAPAPAPVETPPAAAATPPAPTPASPPVAAPATLPTTFFAPDSPWNTRHAFTPQSTAVIGPSPVGYQPTINEGAWSTGIYLASPSDPAMLVYPRDGSLVDETAGVVHTDAVTIPHWPVAVAPSPDTDAEACIVDGDTITSFFGLEFDGQWRAWAVAHCSITGSGCGTKDVPRVGVCAAGVAPCAGIIRTIEMTDLGKPFPHALAMLIADYAAMSGPVPPAFAEDGNSATAYKGFIPMGALVMIDPAFDVTTIADLLIRKIALTLQTYGAFVVDTTGDTPFAFRAESGSGAGRDWHSSVDMGKLQAAMRVCSPLPVTAAPPVASQPPAAPVPPAAPAQAPAAGDSPDGSHYQKNVDGTTVGSPIHFAGDVWDFGAAGGHWSGGYVLLRNGQPAIPDAAYHRWFGEDVSLLVLAGGKLYVRGNYGYWSVWNGTAFVDATDPSTPPAAPTPAPAPSPTPAPAPTPAAPTAPATAGTLTVAIVEAATKLHFGYRPQDVSEAELAALPLSLQDHDPGELGTDWPGTGAAPGIGIVTQASGRWCANPNEPRTEANMVANARAMQGCPYHVQAAEEPGPIKWWKYPNKSTNSSRTGDNRVILDTQPNPYNIVLDAAHLRHPLYTYAIRCQLRGDTEGFAFAIREFKYLLGWQYVSLTDNGRGESLYLCNPIVRQVRDAAWMLATVFQFAAVCPQDDEWFAPTMTVVRNNLDFFVGTFIDGTYDLTKFGPYYDRPIGANKNAVGLMCENSVTYGGTPDGAVMAAPGFQLAFLCTAILFGQRLDLVLSDEYKAKFKRLALFAAQWVVRLFGEANNPTTYDYRRAGLYGGIIGKNGKLFANDAELLSFNGGPLGPDDHVLRGHDSNAPVEGLPYSYFDNIAPALAMADDLGAPGARAASLRFEASTIWAGGGAWPFAITRAGVFYKATVPAATTPAPVPAAPAASPAAAPTPQAATPAAPAAATTPLIKKSTGTIPTIQPQPPAADRGAPVDPATWLLPEGSCGTIPFRNTIKACLPDFLKDSAGNWTAIWPGAAYMPKTQEIAAQNGGHMVFNMGATIYSSLKYLTHEARNCAPATKATAAFGDTGFPDEFGVHQAMHGYNGYVCRPESAGFGPELFVMWTCYGGSPANPCRYYLADWKMGGGGTFYNKDENVPDLSYGGYGIAVSCNFLGGMFVSDTEVSIYAAPQYKHKLGFIPYDMGPVQWGPPTDGDPTGDKAPWKNPIYQYLSQIMAIDEERKYCYVMQNGNADASNGPISGPRLTVWDLDKTRPTFNTHANFEIVGLDPTIQPNRDGFVYLKNKGLVGIHKVPATGISSGIQVILGAHPFTDPPTFRTMWADKGIPALPNDVYGSHVAVPDLGISFLNVGAEAAPWQFNWPKTS